MDEKTIIHAFKTNGIHRFNSPSSPDRCQSIYGRLINGRTFGPTIFLSEQEYRANPVHLGVNPVKGRNAVEKFQSDLDPIDRNSDVVGAINTLLGENFDVFSKKLVCATPKAWIPDWLMEEALNNPTLCLNAYIKEEFRDITFLFGSDFHMDVVDHFKYEDGTPRLKFVTVYTNLCEVTANAAPLVVMPGTHRFGATVFPHQLELIGEKNWTYGDGKGRKMSCSHDILTGPAGSTAVWHSCLLHGAPKNDSSVARISLRSIVSSRSNETTCGLDEINRCVEGPLALGDWEYRTDLDKTGQPSRRFASSIGQVKIA